MRLRIRDRLWRVEFVNARELPKETLGTCDHPPGRHPSIKVRRSQSARKLLEVTVHEVLHAVRPELDEAAVDEAAATIALVLHRLGARIEVS
jgi:hypothetical protein